MNVSIIIPTYNEQENVHIIVQRINKILAKQNGDYEILFVDDSQDQTPAILEQLSRQCTNVKYIHRQHQHGLASAVVLGFEHCCGETIIVMDADLQHPPELIPLILTRLKTADVVIPSRFISGGSDGGLNWFRKSVSWTARTIGRLSVRRLRNFSDCTSGYFGINRSVIEGVTLNPVGWKILLEILVKGHYGSVHEIPYTFVARETGQSKMSIREQWNYLRHIIRLICSSPDDRRFYCFCLIGTLGVIVNLVCLSALLNGPHINELSASVFASLLAMVHNFIWNNHLTWKDRRQPALWRRMLQIPQFMLICGLGIAITALFARIMTSLGATIYLGQLIGIMVATYWSFSANHHWTWSDPATIHPEFTKLVVTQEYAGKPS